MEFKTLKVALADQVATIELNRPERANAMELGHVDWSCARRCAGSTRRRRRASA